jgi:hypothetical protein
MRDIKPTGEHNGERSIRNIPVHRKVRHTEVMADHSERTAVSDVAIPRRRRRHRRFWPLAVGVVALCAIFGLLLSTVFAGATVTVTPRTATVTVPATLDAAPNAPVGVLPYQTVSVTRSSSLSVPAQGTQRVSRPASGVITITNSASAASQRLIANTRFEASDGKIYRIRESVVVPGTTGTGSALKPGTATATVFADSPGPDYNKPAGVTFTIPGFKGDPRYTTFTAVAAAGINGGFIGDEPAVAAADLASAKTTLQQKLDSEVRSAAAAEIPEGFVAVPGTLEVSLSALSQAAGEGKNANLTQSATATGVIIRHADLASAIARSSVEGYKGEAVLFGDASSMDLAVATTSKRADGTITLSLTGQASLVWQFDQSALVTALVGKSKDQFQTVIESFRPAIKDADARVRPFWQGKFPDDPERIKIKVANN